MCGIFATTCPERWRDRMGQVLARLDHRGPDARGVWEPPEGGALLAHTRLEIIGLGQSGAQPAISSDGRIALTYNGEMYNYRAVARGLGMGEPSSDTAVMAELLARRPMSELSLARGMFALAAWDRDEQALVGARDRWGIKPLYALQHGSGDVTLASEIPVLLLDPEAGRLDPIGLAHYLCFGHTGQSITIFQNIKKLVPGSVCRWRRSPGGDLRLSTAPIAAQQAPDLSLCDALEDSVDAHMVADVDVGLFLSGGVDSTLLGVLARDRLSELRTFTLAFPDDPAHDEGPRAEANAALLGTTHRTLAVTASDMARAAHEFVAGHGEPFGDAAALPLTLLAQRAAEEVKVVLTGEGSDEIFGGYARYRVSRIVGNRWVGSLPLRRLARYVARRRGDSPRARALEAVLWGGGIRSHAALLIADLNGLDVRDVGQMADVRSLVATEWEGMDGGDEMEKARRYDLFKMLPNLYLEKMDRATMKAGLEARVPFLDPAVSRAGEAIPIQERDKRQLRGLLCVRLPGVALPARKKGLAVPIEPVLEAGLGEDYRREVESADSLLSRWLGKAGVAAVSERCQRSPTAAFRVAMLGVWESQFGSSSFL